MMSRRTWDNCSLRAVVVRPRPLARATGLLLAALWALSCGRITGVDGYAVGEPRVDNPCGTLEVPLSDGRCERVGVTGCESGFSDDQAGGCAPILPEAACDGLLTALPGNPDCRTVNNCYANFPLLPTGWTGEVRYVRADAPAGGDGSSDQPFGTIQEALESASGPVAILVGPGDYRGNLSFSRRVYLQGVCPEKTTLQADSADDPVVAVGPSGSGSHIGDLHLVGGRGGVAVNGAEVALQALAIQNTEGAGITFEDSAGPTQGTLQVLVDGALGTGIAAYGAKLDIVNSVIRGTRTTLDGDLGRGISAHPSAFSDAALAQQDFERSLAELTPSILTIDNSVIEDNSDAGVFVVGSKVSITHSVIRDTHGQRDGHGRAVVADRWDLGNVPAEVTITRSVLERSADVALRVENSCATVVDTTIRGVGSSPPVWAEEDLERSCLGNGIRVRFNGPVTAPPSCASDTASLEVRNSLLEGMRESGIHVEGAAAVVDHTIVRSVERDACTNRGGDGVAAYGYDFAAASVELTAVRIEKAARAGVAGFGAEATASDSVLECDARDLVAAAGLGRAAGSTDGASSVCGCNGSWHGCSLSSEPLPRALRGCEDPDEASRCMAECASQWLEACSGKTGVIKGMSMWDPDADDIAAAVTDEQGCAIVRERTPGVPFRFKAFAPGQLPELAPGITGSSVPDSFTFQALISGGIAYGSTVIGRPLDFRNAVIAGINVCEQGEWSSGSPIRACFDHGIVGARVELLPPAGVVTYVSDGCLPTTDVPAITTKATTTIYDVPPGEYIIRVLKPDGAAGIDCSAAQLGTDTMLAWPTEVPNEFTMRVEPAALQGAFVFCTVRK